MTKILTCYPDITALDFLTEVITLGAIKTSESKKIINKIKKARVYSPDNLYRVFLLKDDNKTIEDVIEKGTDRVSNEILGDHKTGIYNINEREDIYYEERGRALTPSEYTWVTKEKNLQDQVELFLDKPFFVSVYDGNKMTRVNHKDCYEFNDKQNPQEALVALVKVNIPE